MRFLPTVALSLASALLVKRLSDASHVKADEEVTHADAPGQTLSEKVIPKGVVIFRVFGAFFFGAADKLESSLRRAGQLPDVVILRMRDVLAIDATGLDALEDLMKKLRKHKKDLILCGPHSQPLFALTRAGLIEKLGMATVCGDLDASLERARQIVSAKGRRGLTGVIPILKEKPVMDH